MVDNKKINLILSQAKRLIEQLSVLDEPTISESTVEICDRLVDELLQIDSSDKTYNVGRARSWTGGNGRDRYAYKSDIVSKLSQIIGITETLSAPTESTKTKEKLNVFISHGKKREPLLQMQRFIEALGLNPLVVKEEASKGGSINQVVGEYMSKSKCVILLSTADVNAKDGWHANENVINEEGLAKKYVNNNIIYLLEDKVDKTPSNYQEKVYEKFSEDNMTDAFIKVAKELHAFGLI
jgi:predicted nucleotide-binding protein